MKQVSVCSESERKLLRNYHLSGLLMNENIVNENNFIVNQVLIYVSTSIEPMLLLSCRRKVLIRDEPDVLK